MDCQIKQYNVRKNARHTSNTLIANFASVDQFINMSSLVFNG